MKTVRVIYDPVRLEKDSDFKRLRATREQTVAELRFYRRLVSDSVLEVVDNEENRISGSIVEKAMRVSERELKLMSVENLRRVFWSMLKSADVAVAAFQSLPNWKELYVAFRDMRFLSADLINKIANKRIAFDPVLSYGESRAYGVTSNYLVPVNGHHHLMVVYSQPRKLYDYYYDNYTSYLGLQPGLLRRLSMFVPDETRLPEFVDQPSGDMIHFCGDKDIVKAGSTIGAMLMSDVVEIDGSRLTQTLLRKISKSCRVEPFPGGTIKEYEAWRLQLIAAMMGFLRENRSFRSVAANFFDVLERTAYVFVPNLMPWMTGIAGRDYYDLNGLMRRTVDSLRALSKKAGGRWISDSALIDAVDNRADSLSEQVGIALFSDDKSKNKLTELKLKLPDVRENLYEPFIKSVVMLMSAFGFAEIALDLNRGFTYGFAGRLAYFRITDWGRYALGEISAITVEEVKEEPLFELDDRATIVTLLKGDNPYEPLLAKLSKKISTNCYRLDVESVISASNNADEVVDNLEKLEKFVTGRRKDLPEVWQQFYAAVGSHIVKVKLKSLYDYQLMQLDPADTDFIAAIVGDEEVRSHVILAEDHMMLIKPGRKQALMKRLSDLGFMLH